jgi:shikimate dehydrogenase
MKNAMNGATSKDGIPRACVIGWPIGHSRSPMIHRWWLKQHGLAGGYDKLAVPPGELEEFLLTLSERGLVGCNVTIPHKERAFEIVARANPAGIAPMGRRLRAVNTIWLEDGRLHADNTDVHGFMANFRQALPDWRARGQRVAVLGAGGAARAVVAGFVDAGVEEVTLFNRTLAKAEALAAEMAAEDGASIAARALAELPEALPGMDVLVNATSLGMHGQPPLEIDLSPLPSHAAVADIVYTPLETRLLRQARERGLKAVEGLGMLLHQAAPGFEKWFGPRPRVTDELRRLVAADIEA